MNYRRLGKTGLKVSELSYGSWVTFSFQLEQKEATAMMKLAFDNGINFFDNAAPIATDRPCPSEPDAILTPGSPSCVVGCPCSLELISLNVLSSLTGKKPFLASTL